MYLTALIGELILGFIFGTIVLWICSFTVNTVNANLRTAAIYNGIMAILGGVLMGLAFNYISSESDITGEAFLLSLIVTLVISFWLLMRLYDISFIATVWLVIAMWAVDTGVTKLIEHVF